MKAYELMKNAVLNIIKAILWIALIMMKMTLGILKLFLLLFVLVGRVFLIFVKVGTD